MDDFTSFPTKYWHKLDNEHIQCDLCPRACKLKNGQRGLCFVRANKDQQVVLTTYGKSSGYAIDPIEKKPLFHFLPGTKILSFGTAGCNLTCKFCQNPDISKSREIDTLCTEATPQQIAVAAKQLGCKSVAFTYNEPIIFLEYMLDTAIACRELNIKTVAVTAGYINAAPREELFQYLDAVNVDLKAFDEKFYRKFTGAHLSNILETLQYIKKNTETWLEITTLLIPEHNDSVDEITKMSAWIYEHLGADIPLHFTAFHPAWKMQNVPATPISTLHRAQNIAKQQGLRYVYVGNVSDVTNSSTYCYACEQLLIKRDWHRVLLYSINEYGCCNYCGSKCSGVFDQK